MWVFSASPVRWRVRGLCFHLLVKRKNSHRATAPGRADAHLRDLELSTEQGKRWAQTSESWRRSSRDQGGSLSPFTAWLENSVAALVLWQEQTPADGEVAQVHLGAPSLEFAVACPSGISKL